MARVIKTVTENYTVLDGDDGGIIIGNSSSLITITMPSAIGRATFSLTVMNANSGTVSVLGQDLSQNGEISIANSDNTWTYALGGGGGSGANVLNEEIYIYIGSLITGTGTASLSGSTVTGVGTNFLTEAIPGETILFDSEGYEIFSVDSNTSLTINGSGSISSSGYYLTLEGNDTNSGLSVAEGFASQTRAIEYLKSFDAFGPNAKVYVKLFSRTYEFAETEWDLQSLFFPITIIGDNHYNIRTNILGRIKILFGQQIKIRNIDCTDGFEFNSVLSIDASFLRSLSSTPKTNGAFMFAGVLGGVINNCGFSDGVFDVGMLCAYANVYANSVTGNAIGYGAYATNGSNIYKLGAMPTGTGANEATATAGAIR